jgi:hypothetical protein
MKMYELLEVINWYTEIETIEANEEKAKVYLKEYDLNYTFLFDEIAILEALQIIHLIKINGGLRFLGAGELMRFKRAVNEDLKQFGGIYQAYFFKDRKNEILKDEADKQYLLDYITFINRAAGIKQIRLKK